MSDAPEPFQQFPIALLVLGKEPLDKLNFAIAYATITAGEKREKAIGRDVAKEIVETKWQKEHWEGFHPSEAKHRQWALGKDVVSMSWHNGPGFCVETYRRAMDFLRGFGKTPFVRVNFALMGEAHKGEFEFRDFCVLCAVYAVIGEKQYAISSSRWQRRLLVSTIFLVLAGWT